MDDRAEIERLLFVYAERIDAGDFVGLGDLFADAAITVRGEVVARGRSAVQQMYERTTRLYEDGTPRTKHVTTNVIVEIDAGGEKASARSYFTVLQAFSDLPLQPIIAGRYHDAFVRTSGAWRFADREMIVDLFGDLSRHLLIDVGQETAAGSTKK